MIATYQQSVESKSNKLTAIIAAGDIRTFVNYARTIEFKIKQRDKSFTLTWRKVTTGMVLGYFEHQGRRYDNTYKYLNRISSNLIDFFEFLKKEKGLEGENPAAIAQKILFDELTNIRWNAAESYRRLDAAIRKESNTTAAGAGLHAARTEGAAPAAPARRKATTKRTRQAA